MEFKMKFCTMTLGCKVNQYETQAIERILCEYGHELVDFGDGCDVCILNTCAVTAESVRKSRQAIRRIKKLEPDALIAVCGCYSHLEPDEVADLGVDLIGGATDRGEFARMVKGLFLDRSCENSNRTTPDSAESPPSYAKRAREKKPGRAPFAHEGGTARRRWGLSHIRQTNRPPVLLASETLEELPPGNTANRTRALLKIQDGCNNFCSYCIVPYIRGRSRSLPLTKVAEYAKLLEKQGYKEIVITGIEVSSYGNDLFSKTDEPSPCPASLLTALTTIHVAAPNTRLRLGSLNPSLLTPEFCRELSKIPNLCNHFHLSLQSGCDETLYRMGRKYNTKQVMEGIKSIRKHFNDCSIAADLITGFPGETDEEFLQTLSFIKKAAFADMHIFPYSVRPGTKAAKLPNQVDKSVRKERARAATKIATEMTNEFKQVQLEKTAEVLFEQYKNGYSTGHSTNYLEISVKEKVNRNSIHNVRITGLLNGKLYGEISREP
jgi:threonylcarbamoyladenosine tRNA methylthiotransferase MtaB